MAKALTDNAIKNLKPRKNEEGEKSYYEVSDGGAKGLRLYVGSSGAKSFIVRYRIHGKLSKLTLGPYLPPEARKGGKEPADAKVGDPLTLKAARVLCAEAMLQVGRGLDPVAAKRQDKEAKRQAAEDTFETIAIEYLKRVCGMKVVEGETTFDRDKKRTGHERWLMLQRSVFPQIARRPIAEIKRKEIVRLLDKIEDERGRIASDRTLALLSIIFSWHAKRDDSFSTPLVRGMARDERSPDERSRKRVLDDGEIKLVWEVAKTQGTFGSLVRFLLATGARRDEAAKMPWSELVGVDWELAKERNKTKLDLVRPLNEAAQTVLEGLPRFEGCEFVFSNDGRRAVRGYSKAKKKFDEAVLAKLREQDPEAKPLENWTLHDLRRSSRSLMSRAGVNSDHAERCLGHVIGGVRGVYDRFEYYDEKKDAFEKLAKLIKRIVDPPESTNVVQLKQKEVV